VQLQNDTRALLKAVCDAQQQQQQERQQQEQPSTTAAAAAEQQDLLTQVYEQLDEVRAWV
jgi:hypothetical protein